MQRSRKAIMWFRQDLRLHDNEALTDALEHAAEVIPVYVFDPRVFLGTTRWFGFPKTGRYRARFILESVADLRRSLRAKGSDLVIRFGKPEHEIFDLARQLKTSWVFCNRERTEEEIQTQDALEKNLWSIGQEMRYSRGKMLYYTADLPFPVTQTPDSFSYFRKEVERFVEIREPLPTPDAMPELPEGLEVGELPELSELGHQPFTPDPRSVIDFRGGETQGLARLQHYLWESDQLQDFAERKGELLGGAYSTKFSAWLAQGCLSPKMIYQELQAYETKRGAKKSTYEVFYDLMVRDFFRLMAKKHGNKIFLRGGPREIMNPRLTNNEELFREWREGRTGVPFIDANMREINLTGYMSNRGRQNVASFLVKDLQVNWQMGAEYFESLLIDYDVTSNWGNWNYMAGVDSDVREEPHYNILSQARRYDPQGEYVKYWLPELREIPADRVHRPDTLSGEEQLTWHLRLGDDYPRALVSTEKWA